MFRSLKQKVSILITSQLFYRSFQTVMFFQQLTNFFITIILKHLIYKLGKSHELIQKNLNVKRQTVADLCRFRQQSMRRKVKAFLFFLIIGIVCVTYIPDTACETVGSFCEYSPIVGYSSFGISGVILLHEIYIKCRENCGDSCQDFYQNLCWCLIGCLCYCCRDRYSRSEQSGAYLAQQFLYNQQQNDPEIEQQPGLAAYWENNSFEDAVFYNYEDNEAYRQSFNQKECTICLDQFNQNDDIDRKRCGHKFHKICIRDWLNKNENCPICRLKLK